LVACQLDEETAHSPGGRLDQHGLAGLRCGGLDQRQGGAAVGEQCYRVFECQPGRDGDREAGAYGGSFRVTARAAGGAHHQLASAEDAAYAVAEDDGEARQHRWVRPAAGPQLRLDERDVRDPHIDQHLVRPGYRIRHVSRPQVLRWAELRQYHCPHFHCLLEFRNDLLR